MTRPASSSRVLLIEDRRAGPGPAAVPVRRYRLARLRLDGPGADPGGRFDYLKRPHD